MLFWGTLLYIMYFMWVTPPNMSHSCTLFNMHNFGKKLQRVSVGVNKLVHKFDIAMAEVN